MSPEERVQKALRKLEKFEAALTELELRHVVEDDLESLWGALQKSLEKGGPS